MSYISRDRATCRAVSQFRDHSSRRAVVWLTVAAEVVTMTSDDRLTFQEALNLVKLPPGTASQRFMSTRSAYVPGQELHSGLPRLHSAVYGGVAYGQAALAACRTWRELEDQKGTKPSERLGLHVRCLLRHHSDLSNQPRRFMATSPLSGRVIDPLCMKLRRQRHLAPSAFSQ